MIAIFESIVEVIKFWESFFYVPFIVSGFELDTIEYGSLFCFVLGVVRDGDLEGWSEVVVVHQIQDIKIIK